MSPLVRIDRRIFVRLVGTSAAAVAMGVGCSASDQTGDGDGDGDGDGNGGDGDGPDAGGTTAGLDAGARDAACPSATYTDTYAVALYFDGDIGPLTGVVSADYLRAGEPVDLEFWHGHGGVSHRFVLLPEHYAALLRNERVMIQTTEVEDHSHMLFIDPTDPQYVVPGAEPVEIPVCNRP